MKHSKLIIASSFLLFLFCFSSAFGATFSRNLRLGDRGSDVTALQKFLNVIPASSYFGNLTLQAVIKFQKLYAISPAAGFVGPITRQKLNDLASGLLSSLTPSPTPTPTPTPQNQGLASKVSDLVPFYARFVNTVDSSPVIFLLSAYQVAPNSPLVLYGGHLTGPKSHIFIGQTEVSVSTSTLDTGSTTIMIPDSISPGVYELFAQNEYGNSKNKIKQQIEVTRNPLSKPIVYSIEPSYATPNDTVTVHGANFTATGNSVNTGFGYINNLNSSDGVTLRFSIKDLSGVSKVNADGKFTGSELPLTFLIRNKGGSANQSGLVYVKF